MRYRIKRSFLLLVIVGLCIAKNIACAQPSFEIPGQFVFDIYVSQFDESKAAFPLKLWGSRGISFSYLQEINLIENRLTLNPGIGISSEKYSLNEDITVGISANNTLFFEGLNPSWDVAKTLLAAEYLDVPIEFRFQTAEGYRAFRFALGLKVGWLFNSRSKIKFRNSQDENEKIKLHKSFLFSEWRYGVLARVGLGKLNFFASYDLNPTFEEGAFEEELPDYNPQAWRVGVTFFTF